MDHTAEVTGEMVQGDRPDWDPLMHALLGWFMWMFEVELADGRKVHAYKHIITRDYLHLTHDGRAFVFRPEHSYREVDLEEAVAGLFARWWSLKAPPGPPD
jgi:hypothetical protein